jgi:hypothetical protein
MSSAAEDIGTYLQSLGLGTLWQTIFIDEVVPKTEHISIFNTGGFSPDYTYTRQQINENPSITIQARYNSRSEGYSKLEQIKDILNSLGNIQMGDNFYLFFSMSSDILYIERDEDNRVLYSMNFLTKRHK